MAKLEKSFQALKKGDERAFSEIYRKTHRLVYYTVYQILKDEEAAKDIVQDAYLRVHKNLLVPQRFPESLDPHDCPESRHQRIQPQEAGRVPRGRENRLLFRRTEKRHSLIDLAAKNLPEDEFMILMLCVCERYKRREVAEIMKLSVSGVTWKLNRALDKLRKLAKEAEL